jgi:hypothetical protein
MLQKREQAPKCASNEEEEEEEEEEEISNPKMEASHSSRRCCHL